MSHLSYGQHELQRSALNLMSMWSHLTASQIRFMAMPFTPWLKTLPNPLRAIDQQPVEVEFSNLQTAWARLLPDDLEDYADRLPERATINLGSPESLNNSTPKQDGNQAVREKDKKAAKAKDVKRPEISFSMTDPARNWDAAAKVFEVMALDFPKPEYGIDSVEIDGQEFAVTEETLIEKDFANLIRFSTDAPGPKKKVYIAAPISGHYSTLIRETIRSYLKAGYDVNVYDIKNARDVPSSAGKFGMDELIDYHREFMEYLGPDTNVLAICQATVPVISAAALMAEDNSDRQPASITLMAGPINPHFSKTEVTEFAVKHDISFFHANCKETVPSKYEGRGRQVYPGYRQISNFIAMNPSLHIHSSNEMFNHLIHDDEISFDSKARFYREYRAWADLPWKLYEDTVDKIFIQNQLATGQLEYRGRRINLNAITKPYVLTYEGGRDDISATGQTLYAHVLMPELQKLGKGFHFTLDNAGHYGTFTGKRANGQGLPHIFRFDEYALEKQGFDPGISRNPDGNITTDRPDMAEYAFRPQMLAHAKDNADRLWAEKTANQNSGEPREPVRVDITWPKKRAEDKNKELKPAA